MPQTTAPLPKKRLSLRREIVLVLVAKTLLLYAIWALCFDQPMPREHRADNVSRVILNK